MKTEVCPGVKQHKSTGDTLFSGFDDETLVADEPDSATPTPEPSAPTLPPTPLPIAPRPESPAESTDTEANERLLPTAAVVITPASPPLPFEGGAMRLRRPHCTRCLAAVTDSKLRVLGRSCCCFSHRVKGSRPQFGPSQSVVRDSPCEATSPTPGRWKLALHTRIARFKPL